MTKILHLADLHFGKGINGFNLFEDQMYLIDEIVDVVKDNNISIVLISGDVYDTSSPSAEATILLDTLLAKLNKLHISILMISGNHDSSEKLNFGSTIFADSDIHIITKIKDSLTPIRINEINFYLLPFSRKYEINKLFEKNYEKDDDAFAYLINEMHLDKEETNILLAHQTILNENKSISLGGSENINKKQDNTFVGDVINLSCEIFKDFDYVALGHIHKPQQVASNIRYCGSIFPYSKSEVSYQKTFTILEVENKSINIITKPITFKRPVEVYKGNIEDLLINETLQRDSYLYVDLTEEVIQANPLARIRNVFPNTVSLTTPLHDYEIGEEVDYQQFKLKTKEEIFIDFFKQRTGKDLDDEQLEIVHNALGENL